MMAFLQSLLDPLGFLIIHQRRQRANHVRVEGHSDDDPNNVEPLLGKSHRVDISEADGANRGNGPVEGHCGYWYPSSGCSCRCTRRCR